MPSVTSRVTHWVATPVLAVLAATVAQVVVFQAAGALVYAISGAWPGGPATWALKTVTSLFMGATFVAMVWWVAPETKYRAAAVAFGVVLLWGGTLMFGAFERGFFVWLFAMGAAGIAGGASALWLGQRTLATRG